MLVLTPHTLDEALQMLDEHPAALMIQGGTDVMVAINFDRIRPEVVVNLAELTELRSWRRENGSIWLGAGLTYLEALEQPLAGVLPALAEASRTVGSPQIRIKGTIGGNLGTASPAGDALPPLLVEGATVEIARAGASRTVPLDQFLVGPKQNALEPGELIAGVRVTPSGARQTFMKIGPRNAMVISICSLAVLVDEERGTIRAAFGSAAPVVRGVELPLDASDDLPEAIDSAASPIDDVRATARYRRHALGVLTRRALERCLR